MQQDKHKHTQGHVVEVEITDKLIQQFKNEACMAICDAREEKWWNFRLRRKLDHMRNGYLIAKINAYKENNGVPPVPFPVSFSTVDMAPWAFHDGELKLLLGRKPGQTQFQFAGGFRDPKETNAEAASRELTEEMLLKILVSRFEQIGQLFIDDIRYRNSCHKVTTTLFNTHITYEEMLSAKAGDDLEEVKIFSINDLIKDNSPIRDIHRKLFEMLWQYLLSVPEQSSYIMPRNVANAQI